ncbi:MAG: hypothetical protein Q4E35_08480 [Eubacteriales bacterium]|nr:hypothetical protein [Eubacteriales bacterium]
MKNGWRIIISIVLIAILLGGVCLGVGIITGAEMDRVYSVLDKQYNLTALYKYVTEDLVTEFQRVGLLR